MINFFKAQSRLFNLWIGGSIFLIGVFALQTIGGRYIGITKAAWSWLFSERTPTLSLVLFAFFKIPDQSDNDKNKTIQKQFFLVTGLFSIIYFLAVFGLIYFYTDRKGFIIDYYNRNSFILNWFKIPLGICLGLFFRKPEN